MNNILRQFFPFVATIILWYLSEPRFNPFGILSLVPIFYYRFCYPVKRWFFFGFLMCFLLDFNAGTLFLFSSVFLLMDALNAFFGILEKDSGSGFYIKSFSMFLGLAVFFIFSFEVFGAHRFFVFLAGAVWLYFWLFLLYFPFVALFKWIGHDR
ncbi:MAG: hypothetical protein LBT45_01415 [Rickettsiales bacterium]|nr:hypothetical protein [Rickettsiales bacterium]